MSKRALDIPSRLSRLEQEKEVLMVEIRVLNKRSVGDRGEYVGRPSALGNPFKLEQESKRDAVIQQYELWLQERIKARDARVCQELNRLYRIARDQGVLELTCWCAPKRCHADVIRNILLEVLNERR
jgi:Domain of unknown function (DUF4326)